MTEIFTQEEYLEMEERNEFKSEYYAGEIFAMAGGTYRHSAICSILHRRIGNLLDGKACIPFDIDFQKINFAALSVGNGRKLFKASAAKRPIPSLLSSENHYLKSYNAF